jgi:hypothetical protein
MPVGVVVEIFVCEIYLKVVRVRVVVEHYMNEIFARGSREGACEVRNRRGSKMPMAAVKELLREIKLE